MPKICPLRLLAAEMTSVTLEDFPELTELACLEENCAWWNDDFGCCSIAALATVATRPVVIEEQLGHD